MLEAEEVWQQFRKENSVHVCMRSDYRETRTGKAVIYTSQSNTEKSSGRVFLFMAAFWQPHYSAIRSNNWTLEPSHELDIIYIYNFLNVISLSCKNKTLPIILLAHILFRSSVFRYSLFIIYFYFYYCIFH